jgi:hypothetical protein
VAGTIDLLPTLVTMAGGEVPAEPVIDGRDISGLLFGESKEPAREAHYYFAGYNLQAVRQGPWKLAIAAQAETMGKGTAPDAAGGVPRLYNLDREIGEKTNVATEHPQIVSRLRQLAEAMSAEIGGKDPAARRPAGEVAEPKMLYAAEGGPRRGHPAETATKVASLDSLKAGDVLSPEAAPQVGNTPFAITCAVETAMADAVIVAHGGLAAGYALHIRGGRVVFAVRTGGGDAVAEVAAPEVVEGPVRIVANLARDGSMSLSLNERVVASGRSAGLIPRQPQEDFCVGLDNGKPVTSYSIKRPFVGTVSGLEVKRMP